MRYKTIFISIVKDKGDGDKERKKSITGRTDTIEKYSHVIACLLIAIFSRSHESWTLIVTSEIKMLGHRMAINKADDDNESTRRVFGNCPKAIPELIPKTYEKTHSQRRISLIPEKI